MLSALLPRLCWIHQSQLDSPYKGTILRSFDVFFVIGLNNLLNNKSSDWPNALVSCAALASEAVLSRGLATSAHRLAADEFMTEDAVLEGRKQETCSPYSFTQFVNLDMWLDRLFIVTCVTSVLVDLYLSPLHLQILSLSTDIQDITQEATQTAHWRWRRFRGANL